MTTLIYDHINYDLHDYSSIIWAKKQEAIPRLQTAVAYAHVSW